MPCSRLRLVLVALLLGAPLARGQSEPERRFGLAFGYASTRTAADLRAGSESESASGLLVRAGASVGFLLKLEAGAVVGLGGAAKFSPSLRALLGPQRARIAPYGVLGLAFGKPRPERPDLTLDADTAVYPEFGVGLEGRVTRALALRAECVWSNGYWPDADGGSGLFGGSARYDVTWSARQLTFGLVFSPRARRGVTSGRRSSTTSGWAPARAGW